MPSTHAASVQGRHLFAAAAFAAAILAALPSRAQDVDVRDLSKLPFMKKEGIEAYKRFLASKQHRAFALAESGEFAASAGQRDNNAAFKDAMERCDRLTQNPCVVYAVNNEVVMGQTYGNLPWRALERMKTVKLAQAEYAGEGKDFKIAPLSRYTSGPFHAPTPKQAPGAKTITTRALRDLILSDADPVLVDVYSNDDHFSLPSAVRIKDGGGNLDPDGDRAFRARMAELADRKDRAVAFFCLSAECWLSWNASLRAVRAGYSNVYWYRGGIESWHEAKLPMVLLWEDRD